MSRFQLHWHHEQIVAGKVHIHVRLNARRSDAWQIVGVLVLVEDEWNDLVAHCQQLGMEVVHGV